MECLLYQLSSDCAVVDLIKVLFGASGSVKVPQNVAKLALHDLGYHVEVDANC